MKKKIVKQNKKVMFFIEKSIYPYDILFTNDYCPPREIEKFIHKEKKYHLSDVEYESLKINEYSEGRTITLGNGNIILRLKTVKTKVGIDVPVLVHELSHVIHSIFNSINYEVDNENDETFAYYIGYLTRRILEKLDK